jgi:pimeloyl-ACP methyl ester carboxylesterase/ketosteroid isomerase-like protein
MQNANVKLVKEYFLAVESANLGKVLEILDDDVVWNIAGSTNVSTVGLLKGKEQVVKWLLDFPQKFETLAFSIDDYFSNESEVLVIGKFRHMIKSTGRIMSSNMIMRFSVCGEKISRYQIMEDSYLLNQAFAAEECWNPQTIKVNGNIYAYEDRGIGEPIIFAHGLFLNHTTFNEQINLLEKSFRCLSFDMPGHGASSYNKEGWTLESLADDLALFVRENDLQPITFVGQSFGGTVGMIFAARYPELIGKLILVGTTAREEVQDRRENWHEIKQYILSNPSNLEEFVKEMQAKNKNKEWLAKNQDKAEQERKMMISHDLEGLGKAIDAAVLKRKNITNILSNVKCWTLVIAGKDDRATPLELSEEIVNKIPNSALKIVNDAGHHLHIEQPEALSKIMMEFLSM